MLYHMTSYKITNPEKCKVFMSEYENPFIAQSARRISVHLRPHRAGVDAQTTCFCGSSPPLPNGYVNMVFDARTMLDYIYRATMRQHH